MLDKNQEELKVGDYVNINSLFARQLGPYRQGIIARIDKRTRRCPEDVLVITDDNGVILPLPSASSALTKAEVSDDKKAELIGVLSMFREIEQDLRYA